MKRILFCLLTVTGLSLSGCMNMPYQSNQPSQIVAGINWGDVLPWVIVAVLGIIIIIMIKKRGSH